MMFMIKSAEKENTGITHMYGYFWYLYANKIPKDDLDQSHEQKNQNMYQYFTNEVRDDIIKYFDKNPVSNKADQKKNFIIYMCVKFCETNGSHVNFSLIQKYTQKLESYYEVRKKNWLKYEEIKDDREKMAGYFQKITKTKEDPRYLEIEWNESGCIIFYVNNFDEEEDI